MNFQKKSIQKKYSYSQRKKQMKKARGSSLLFKFIVYTLAFAIVLGSVLLITLYQKYIKDLPSIKELENLEIAEASTIYDREGGELYKIYKEKRTYISYEDINKNMINAIIAGEDKRYWENPGVDLIGIIRAVSYRLLGKTSRLEGTSTLTQQLVRNTIIANERKIERKIKEIYLSYKLSKGLSKEKILELYLNKISFGHNSYGIEQAAKTFFGKNARNLGVLESSILASLPKGPTYYSPYNHPGRTLGYLYSYEKEEDKEVNTKKILTVKEKIEEEETVYIFKKFIKELKAKPIKGSNKIVVCNLNKAYFKNNLYIDKDGCSIIEYEDLLNFLNSIRIQNNNIYIEYQTGRKDFILGRMLEDGYIDFQQYKNSIIESIGYDFPKTKESINAPHFVFFVKELLEQKYGKEIIESGGLKIFTTLDPDLQIRAEEIVEKQTEINLQKFDAGNAALISIDNKTGQIISMVGGKDYFDKENKGNVNIITSKLQPGSTFKPFVYSMALFNNKIGSKTPVYDVETEFTSKYTPANFDGSFFGKMNISSALNNSRNIPAIKMFPLAGGEKAIIAFMEKIGVYSLKKHNMYGAPLALGTGEMTPLELAGAYSVYANLGVKKQITPILKIVDSKGNVVEEYKNNEGEQVISAGQTYITNEILSDALSRPEPWNHFLTIPNRKLASKTGTSTKQSNENGKKNIAPRNLWTIGYTPQITTVVWAGNTDGKPLNIKGNGLEGAGPIMRDYMTYVHRNKTVEEWKKPKEVKEITISEISGLLPNLENGGNAFLEKSLFINEPTEYDTSFKKVTVDIMCAGIVSNNTPKDAIKKVNFIKFQSLIPTNKKWEGPVQKWANAERPYLVDKKDEPYYKSREKYGNTDTMITKLSSLPCTRSGKKPSIQIKTSLHNTKVLKLGKNYIDIGYKSENPIIEMQIYINNTLIETKKIASKNIHAFTHNITVPSEYKNKNITLSIELKDSHYYTYKKSLEINIKNEDFEKPSIILENPKKGSIKIYENTYFNLRAQVKDRSEIEKTEILINGEIIANIQNERNIIFPFNSEKNLSPGSYDVAIKAYDTSGNYAIQKIHVEILKN